MSLAQCVSPVCCPCSDGFPLAKAQAYADATRPFLINDLHMQVGRCCIYSILVGMKYNAERIVPDIIHIVFDLLLHAGRVPAASAAHCTASCMPSNM
jgi:hypothetical protein